MLLILQLRYINVNYIDYKTLFKLAILTAKISRKVG